MNAILNFLMQLAGSFFNHLITYIKVHMTFVIRKKNCMCFSIHDTLEIHVKRKKKIKKFIGGYICTLIYLTSKYFL